MISWECFSEFWGNLRRFRGSSWEFCGDFVGNSEGILRGLFGNFEEILL